MLSQKAAEVTCCDLSRKRSEINAVRNAECDNVTIHVGNFRDIEPDLPRDYDFIFLIGVFEYGQGYIGSDNPYETFLQMLKKHLRQGGIRQTQVSPRYLPQVADCAMKFPCPLTSEQGNFSKYPKNLAN